MFDIWFNNVEVTNIIMVLCAVLLLPVQLFLCFKIKSLFLRLLPVTTLGAVGGWFLILSICVSGWDGLGYTVLAIYAAMMLFACVLGWAVWGICMWRGKRRKQ